MMKKIISAMLVICILVGLLSVASSAAFPKTRMMGYSTGDLFDSYTPGKDALQMGENGDKVASAYELIVKGVKDLDDEISLVKKNNEIKNSITLDELSKIYEALLGDHPEIFWLASISCTYSEVDGVKYVYSVLPQYTGNVVEVLAQSLILKGKANELLKGLVDRNGKPLLSTYDFTLELHDRLCQAVEYISTENDQTAYGAIVEGKAVCAGYSRAYQYLLNLCGIDAWTVPGNSVSPLTESVEPHAWTLVCLDGLWYYTDVTWDDCKSEGDDVFHGYFNCDDATLEDSHTPDEWIAPFLPVCNSLKHNYFENDGARVNSFDVDEAVAMLEAGRGVINVFYTGGDCIDYINDFAENFQVIAYRMGATGSVKLQSFFVGQELKLYFISNVSFDSTLDGDVNAKMNPSIPTVLTLKKNGYTVEKQIIQNGDKINFENLLPGEYTVETAKKGYISAAAEATVEENGSFHVDMRAYGDVNNDNSVNSVDMNLSKRMLSGSFEYSQTDTMEKVAADCNGDAKINATDLLEMKKFVTGISDYLGK